MGSLLVGLGIILILAHNWDDFSKSLKTAIAFLPLVVGQAFVGYAIFKDKSAAWKEASGTFLFFAVGACIALISQIYNIPGNLSGYLLTWTLLCLPLVYLLRSKALLLLCLVFATYYACNFGYGYLSSANTPWWYLLLVASIFPFYIKWLQTDKQSNTLSVFHWLFPLSLTMVLGAFTVSDNNFGYLMYVILFGLFYNIGKLPYFSKQKLRRNGYLIIGSLGTVITMLMASFKWLWEDVNKGGFEFNYQELGIVFVLFVSALAVFYWLYIKLKSKALSLFQIVFEVFTILFFLSYVNTEVPVVLTNILLFVLGLNAVQIGVKTVRFGVLNYGLLIITALIVCRFFDTDMSFVLRGLLFVSVGAGFFVTNYVMLKKQNTKP